MGHPAADNGTSRRHHASSSSRVAAAGAKGGRRGDTWGRSSSSRHLVVASLFVVSLCRLSCGSQAFQQASLSSRWYSTTLSSSKGKLQQDISREFAKRLADDDEDEAPLRRKTLSEDPSSPSGGGGGGLNKFFTLPGTRGYSKESGNDYWIDPALDKKAKKKKRPPPKDQFPSERIKAEIVSPYKNNWILFIMITIFSLAFFGFLFPEELVQVPAIRIPDFEATPTPFGQLKQ